MGISSGARKLRICAVVWSEASFKGLQITRPSMYCNNAPISNLNACSYFARALPSRCQLSRKEPPPAHTRGLRGRRREAGQQLQWRETLAGMLLPEGCDPFSRLGWYPRTPPPLDPTEASRVLGRHPTHQAGLPGHLVGQTKSWDPAPTRRSRKDTPPRERRI